MGDLRLSKVFIIGAGFSKGIANYPTSIGLIKSINDKAEEYSSYQNNYYDLAIDFKNVYGYYSDQLKNNLENFQKSINRNENAYHVLIDEQIDIEYLITLIDLNLEKQLIPRVDGLDCNSTPVLFTEDFSRCVFKNARKFIQIMLFDILRPDTDIYPIKWDVVEKFVGLISPTDIILTFNYDLLLEQILMKYNLWNPINGYEEFGLQQHSGEINNRDYLESKVKLIKLHGSINWEKIGFFDKLDNRDSPNYFLCDRCTGTPLIDDFDSKVTVPMAESHYIPDSALIFPSFIKQFDKTYEQKMIKMAINKISKTSGIYILGYSLPTPDTTANILFSFIPKNIETSIVLFEDENNLEDRLKNQFRLTNMKFFPNKIEEWLLGDYTSKEFEDALASNKMFEELLKC